MEAEGEGGDDAEIAAATTQTPEQVRILLRRGHHLATVGRHHLGAQQIVAGIAELALDPAAAAAERQPRDPGRRGAAAGHGEAELRGGPVELAPVEPGFRPAGPCHWIDLELLHPPEV